MLRRFFYACIGLLLLAVAYHLGAATVNAQAANQVTVGNINPEFAGGIAAVVGRVMIRGSASPGLGATPLPAIPGTSPVVAVCGTGAGPDAFAMLSDGDVYMFDGSGWSLLGNMLGSATQARATSMGALKARFR